MVLRDRAAVAAPAVLVADAAWTNDDVGRNTAFFVLGQLSFVAQLLLKPFVTAHEQQRLVSKNLAMALSLFGLIFLSFSLVVDSSNYVFASILLLAYVVCVALIWLAGVSRRCASGGLAALCRDDRGRMTSADETSSPRAHATSIEMQPTDRE